MMNVTNFDWQQFSWEEKKFLLFCYLWKYFNNHVIYQLCFWHIEVSGISWKNQIF